MKQLFLILLSTLLFVASNAQQVTNYQQALDRGDTLLRQGKFGEAINIYLAAQAYNPLKKDSVKQRITTVYITILALQKKADSLYKTVSILNDNLKNNIAALNRSYDTIKLQKDSIGRIKDSVYKITLSNAPYKYIRLIRDGPKDPERIKNEQFDLKLIAYCNHLDILEGLLDTIPHKKNEYAELKEKLYYNNDLYEKIFFAFSSLEKGDNDLLQKAPEDKPDTYFDSASSGNGYQVNFVPGNGSITIQSKGVNGTFRAPGAGQKFTSFALSKNLPWLFCGTDDNYIYVYELKDESIPKQPIEKIPMGIKVTGLAFDEVNNIIYFGTASGDIGFIKYADTSGRRNQPVYDNENALGSQITGLNIFEYLNDTFLLAAAYDGKAAVYKIDSNFLKPGNKFSGNFLPQNQKNIKNITNAKFDPEKNIILQTTSKFGKKGITYLWNPFTKSALEAYKSAMQKTKENYSTALGDMMNENKFY